LFGHELGHFLNEHFTARANVPPAQQEEEADRFAGCAVARLGGEWDVLADLLSRLRREKDELYPNRVQSLEAALQGFRRCGGNDSPPEQPFSLDGPSVNFGCEESQSSTVTYTAPIGYVILNVNADIARSDNTRSRSARIISNDGRKATAVADFRGLDREFFNCRGGGNGTVRIHGTIIRDRR
jgi:hypothetical protein